MTRGVMQLTLTRAFCDVMDVTNLVLEYTDPAPWCPFCGASLRVDDADFDFPSSLIFNDDQDHGIILLSCRQCCHEYVLCVPCTLQEDEELLVENPDHYPYEWILPHRQSAEWLPYLGLVRSNPIACQLIRHAGYSLTRDEFVTRRGATHQSEEDDREDTYWVDDLDLFYVDTKEWAPDGPDGGLGSLWRCKLCNGEYDLSSK